MAHKTEVVKTEQLTDESVAIRIRCCGNPKTDSVVTVYGVAKKTQEQIEAIVSKHHDRVAAKCNCMVKAKSHLAGLLTQTKEHPEHKG